jgi:hypothetical protein
MTSWHANWNGWLHIHLAVVLSTVLTWPTIVIRAGHREARVTPSLAPLTWQVDPFSQTFVVHNHEWTHNGLVPSMSRFPNRSSILDASSIPRPMNTTFENSQTMAITNRKQTSRMNNELFFGSTARWVRPWIIDLLMGGSDNIFNGLGKNRVEVMPQMNLACWILFNTFGDGMFDRANASRISTEPYIKGNADLVSPVAVDVNDKINSRLDCSVYSWDQAMNGDNF